MVCLVLKMILLLFNLCLYQIASVAFSADSGIQEIEDREWGKDHMNRYVPQLELSMIQGAWITNTRDGIGKMEW